LSTKKMTAIVTEAWVPAYYCHLFVLFVTIQQIRKPWFVNVQTTQNTKYTMWGKKMLCFLNVERNGISSYQCIVNNCSDVHNLPESSVEFNFISCFIFKLIVPAPNNVPHSVTMVHRLKKKARNCKKVVFISSSKAMFMKQT
jgi:hypothetical protein